MFQSVSLLCDTEVLRTVFTRLGFTVLVHNNLTAGAMRQELQKLGSRSFSDEDALVSRVTHLQGCNISDNTLFALESNQELNENDQYYSHV